MTEPIDNKQSETNISSSAGDNTSAMGRALVADPRYYWFLVTYLVGLRYNRPRWRIETCRYRL